MLTLRVLLKKDSSIKTIDIIAFLHIRAGYIGDKSSRKSTTNYLKFVGTNLLTLSKKQNVVSQFCATKCRAMPHIACELP